MSANLELDNLIKAQTHYLPSKYLAELGQYKMDENAWITLFEVAKILSTLAETDELNENAKWALQVLTDLFITAEIAEIDRNTKI